MDGMFWIMLISVVVGFIAGYRYGTGHHLSGSVSSRLFNTGEKRSEFRTPLRRAEKAKPIDPVCHEEVSQEHAKPSVHGDVIYYFCSRECREIFEAAPDLYARTFAEQRPAINT